MVPSSVAIAPPAFDLVSAAGIGGLAVVVALLFTAVVARGRPRRLVWFGLLVAVVMTLSAVAAATGVLARFDRMPPPMALMVGGVLASALAIGVSPLGRDAAAATPLVALVGVQSFRLPLELVMHRAGTLGIMPAELSYSGYNFDIVTGAGAAVIATLMWAGARVPLWVVRVWNIWGLWCLGVITVVAVTASPMVRLFGDEPRHLNTWVLFFPYVWLPVVLVTCALAGHLIVARALAITPAATSRASV